MQNKNNYTCIVDAAYPLMLYILYASDEMLEHTTFYVGNVLKDMPLPKKVVMTPIEPYTNKELVKYRLRCLKYRQQLKQSVIFAQDHLYFSAPLIDNLPYNIIEDCPNFFIIREERNEIRFKPTISASWYNFKVGRIYQRYAGHNPWCIKRIVTSMRDVKLFNERSLSYEYVSLEKLWASSSEQKKKFVTDVFLLPSLDTIKKDVVIFSQPLCHDAHMSVDEIKGIYKPYIERYKVENIIVKLHPRDTFDYQKAFPGISTLSTKAPQQLLDLMGIKFKTAITVCSSAVSSMDKNCDIIWIGAEIDERIVNAYGHVKCPL